MQRMRVPADGVRRPSIVGRHFRRPNRAFVPAHVPAGPARMPRGFAGGVPQAGIAALAEHGSTPRPLHWVSMRPGRCACNGTRRLPKAPGRRTHGMDGAPAVGAAP
ncbi:MULTISPECIES: quinol oxidase [Burkholderia]|uniref:Quinol oxidase n=1 Tax=Burkholderia paludis TaxID=1506587 RepID=A0A6P2N0Y3_9BURK|nr:MULTISPECIES: quinol oxidase [Burkholderia]CAB3760998.1 hypothetical protein LMG30113_03820 [Burkholderia paludis]VWB86289.1 quinol oxidase [Burkholderia paludis]